MYAFAPLSRIESDQIIALVASCRVFVEFILSSVDTTRLAAPFWTQIDHLITAIELYIDACSQARADHLSHPRPGSQ